MSIVKKDLKHKFILNSSEREMEDYDEGKIIFVFSNNKKKIEIFCSQTPKTEVIQKHKNPFSRTNARRSTISASDLVAEINSRFLE